MIFEVRKTSPYNDKLICELHKVDFFNKLDTDGSMSLSREEFRDGILMAGIPMTENEIESLLNVLDKDGDGEINYRFDQLAFNYESRDFGYAMKLVIFGDHSCFVMNDGSSTIIFLQSRVFFYFYHDL